MKFHAERISPRLNGGYMILPTIRILPELTLSFERNPNRDLYIYAGWLIFGWECHFCFCREA
jgi:hypothetical protein